jgi:hypothetical protein
MLNKIKICAFGVGLLGCSQAFSMDHWSFGERQKHEEFVRQGKTPVDQCLRFFTSLNIVIADDVRSKYSGLTRELLKARDETFTTRKDACLLRDFLDKAVGSHLCSSTGRYYPFIFNILKYAILSLGPKYKPNCAAMYTSMLSREIRRILDADFGGTIAIGAVFPIGFALDVVHIIDSYEELSADEKLQVVEFFLTGDNDDLVASIFDYPKGDFEKKFFKYQENVDFSPEGRRRFDELKQNPKIAKFLDFLKEELHRRG